MIKINQWMGPIKIFAVFLAIMFMPKLSLALDDAEAEKLKAEIIELEKTDPELAVEVKEELKEAVIKGEIQVGEKEENTRSDAYLGENGGMSTEQALKEIAKHEQDMIKGGLTADDVVKLKEMIASGNHDPEAFEAIMEKMKGDPNYKGDKAEGAAQGELLKEMMGFDPKELGRPTLDGREAAMTKEMMERMAKEMGKDITPEQKEQMERMAKEMGRGDMSIEKMEKMAKEMGHEITPQDREQMERMVTERGTERGDMERMAREFEKFGLDRETMEKEMREHEGREFADREKGDTERFREMGERDREMFEREMRERPEFEREMRERMEQLGPPMQPPPDPPPGP